MPIGKLEVAGVPVTVVMGRWNYSYLYAGYGQKPLRIDLTDGTIAYAGIPGPEKEPDIAIGVDLRFYIARVDTVASGTQYTLPPQIAFSGVCQRPAVATAYLSGDGIGSVSVVDGGRGYLEPPDISLFASTGSGAVFQVILDTGSDAPGTIATSQVIRNADYTPCLTAVNYDGVAVTAAGTIQPNWSLTDTYGNIWTVARKVGTLITYRVTLVGSASGATPTQTTNAVVELTFNSTALSTTSQAFFPTTLTNANVAVISGGAGYDPTKPFVLEIPGSLRQLGGAPDYTKCGESGTQPLIVELYTADNPYSPTNQFTDSVARPIKSVAVLDGGTGYTGNPTIILSSTGGNAVLRAETEGGAITSVTVLYGGSFSSPPGATADSGGAALVPIARAHLRGVYQCAYRWVDDTPPDRGGPICSSISPIQEVDCGEGAGSLVWDVEQPPDLEGRKLKLELWRSSSNQAYTLYRLPESAETLDDLTDAELTNADRDNYLAMPILLPNGELNATRFGVPPVTMSVACMYQDRLWIAGDTTGANPNSLYYSEVDEPESMPDSNELVLQTNVKGHDHITALIPYGGSLGVMQAHHAYRLSYVAQPLIDANVQLAAYRGCLNQRCWDEYEGVIYAMDTDGVYAMDQSGQVKNISDPIADLWMGLIDFGASQWFSIVADKNLNCLRVSVRLVTDDPGEYPTRQFCFSFITNGWWEERYPNSLVGGCNLTDATGYYRCFYGAANGKTYAIGYGNTDVASNSIGKVTLTNRGSGYTLPPKVTVSGGAGAVIEAAVDGDGGLLGLYVRCGGYGYEDPEITIEPPADGEQATAECELVNGPVGIPCWHKSGNMEYPSDALVPPGKGDQSRNVAVLFSPTQGTTPLKLRMYYNNQPYPRSYRTHRERGDGVIYQDNEPSVVIDMDAGLVPENISSGVCRALFTGHTMEDIRGNDKHVAVEVASVTSGTSKVILHQLDVFGVPTPQGG